jgi:hypothetical protein
MRKISSITDILGAHMPSASQPRVPRAKVQPLFEPLLDSLGVPFPSTHEYDKCVACGYMVCATTCHTQRPAHLPVAPETVADAQRFEVGDRVRCVESDGLLTLGAVYTVTVDDDSQASLGKAARLIGVAGMANDLPGFCAYRFELVSRAAKAAPAEAACPEARAAGLPAGWRKHATRNTYERVDMRAGVWTWGAKFAAGGPSPGGSYHALQFPGRGSVMDNRNLFATAAEAARYADEQLAKAGTP